MTNKRDKQIAMARTGRWLTLAGLTGLLGLIVAWNAWIAPSQIFPVALVLLIQGMPLLLPLHGLLHGRPYTHAWTAFLSLAYFAFGIMEAYSNPPERPYALLMVLFSLMLFAGCIVYARFQSRLIKES